VEALPTLEQRAVQAFQQAMERRRQGKADLAPTLAFRPGDIGNIASESAAWNLLSPKSAEPYPSVPISTS
jgi:hypothetical protein